MAPNSVGRTSPSGSGSADAHPSARRDVDGAAPGGGRGTDPRPVDDGYLVFDATLRCTSANRAAEAMFGRPASEMIGRPIEELATPGDHGPMVAAARGALAEGVAISYTGYCPRVEQWLDIRAIPDDGRLLLLLSDVTDHRLRAGALAASERRFRDLIETAGSAIVHWRADGTILYANPHLERLFAYEPGELVGRDVRILLPESASSGESLAELVEQIVGDPHAFQGHVNENITRDGRRLWVAWTNAVLRDDHGRVAEVIGVGNDISDRMEAEESLRRHAAVTAGVARIFKAAIESPTEEHLGGVCLAVAREATGSAIGFMAEFDEEARSLIGVAVSDPDHATPSQSRYGSDGPDGAIRVPIGGLYERMVTDRRPIFTNDPERHPGPTGLPAGPSPLSSLLCVPLVDGVRLFGMVALGNRPGGYGPPEVEIVEALAPSVVQAFLYRRSEARLRERAEELETVMDLMPVAVWVSRDPRCESIIGNRMANTFYEAEPGENVSAGPVGGGKRDTTRRFFSGGRELGPEELPMQVAAATGQEVTATEMEVLAPSGRRKWIYGNARPLRGPDGATRGAIGAFMDISERKLHEEQLRRLVNELNHRVKNTLATVQALARQTADVHASPTDFVTAFEDRLLALSWGHDLLTQRLWQEVGLADVLDRALAGHSGGEDRIRVTGPDAKLLPSQALGLGLALHELATNAAKYGALSVPDGRVHVDWSTTDDGQRLHIEWRESGGPAVVPPGRTGFGLRMLQEGLPHQLEGTVRLDFDSSGLRCSIDFPVEPPEEVHS